jgi:hypothetical protein
VLAHLLNAGSPDPRRLQQDAILGVEDEQSLANVPLGMYLELGVARVKGAFDQGS